MLSRCYFQIGNSGMSLATYLVFFLISHQLLLSLSEEEINPRCPPFNCGNLGNIGFPFSNRTHPECGLFVVDNCNELFDKKIQLVKNESFFYVRDISQDNTLWLHDHPFSESFNINPNCNSFRNMTLPHSPFISFNITSMERSFKCPHTHYRIPKNYSLLCNFSTHSVIHFNLSNIHKGDFFHFNLSNGQNQPHNSLPSPPQCSVIRQQVTKTGKNLVFNNIFTSGFGFLLQVYVTRECFECHWRGGRCLEDSKGNFNCSSKTETVNVTRECFECHWRGGQCKTDNKGNFYCSKAETGNQQLGLKLKLQLGIGIGVVPLLVCILIIIALCFKKRLSSNNSMIFWKKKCKDYQNIEAFLRNYGSLAPKRYNYSNIKRMTNSFKHKLGEGGYGGVYKGKLLDGRNVAVKVLNGSKGNGEDFINEVASISRTSHVNTVGLFGYCFESQGRALIYEFVPNGSLEKFIYEKYSTNKQLKWEKLYQIALGIAQGLEYLHRGCSTQILHFDIKPHNILLDEDFCPKISDFGLAKICPRKESIVSMTGARGTIGYIAPEVVCRNFGEVSHKSDVYSYGMMVLEMAGGRKNLDVGVGRTSEIYFPHWIYERLEVAEELRLQGIEYEEDNECARKMLIVSLWCIQTNPSNRPTMSRVVEMLEGSIDSLQFPPKPFLSSPRSKVADSLPSIVC